MTNKDRQKSLDKQKYEMSEECEKDLSGEMLYCDFCACTVNGVCVASQEEREAKNLCARAYNRMKRR